MRVVTRGMLACNSVQLRWAAVAPMTKTSMPFVLLIRKAGLNKYKYRGLGYR